jgi:hypothetical protein
VAGGRVGAFDACRGLAVLLMLVDHVAAVLPVGLAAGAFGWYRVTLGRLAMPAFMLLMGVLWVRPLSLRPSSSVRLLQVVGAGLLVSLMGAMTPGLDCPDILMQVAALLLCFWWAFRWPVVALVLGYVQAVAWPIAWNGYQPGLVAMFIAAGMWWGRENAAADLRAFGSAPAWLQAIGRRPLTWYVGHVFVLWVLFMEW